MLKVENLYFKSLIKVCLRITSLQLKYWLNVALTMHKLNIGKRLNIGKY